MIMLGQNVSLIYEKLSSRILSNRQETKDNGIGRLFAINTLISCKSLTERHIEESNLFRSLNTLLKTKINLNLGLLSYWIRLVKGKFGQNLTQILLMLENAVNSPNNK